MSKTIKDILDYWFRGDPLDPQKNLPFWFGKDPKTPETDRFIGETFSEEMQLAGSGALDSWAETPDGRLALIILLDQFPRNVFRGTTKAHEFDSKAVQVALSGLDTGVDRKLRFDQFIFFTLPLKHAEDLAMQQRAVKEDLALLERIPANLRERFYFTLQYAFKYRDIIERFGRFPHRNQIFGRPSTPDELAFLKTSSAEG